MNINGKLSEDIVKVIFSKLPLSCLPNCRIVCKSWSRFVLEYASSFSTLLIPNPFSFCTADITTQQQQLTYPKIICTDFDSFCSLSNSIFNLYAFCNGLLHVSKALDLDMELWSNGIWNPMTDDFFLISGPEDYDDTYRYGFGLTLNSNLYKLFRITDVFNDENQIVSSTVEVWRFGIPNQWEHLPSHPFQFPDPGTYFDGLLYWYAHDLTHHSSSVVYALDVQTELFETDAFFDVGSSSPAKLHLLNGTICLNVFYPPHRVEIWMMRGKHSWIKQLVLDLPTYTHDNYFHPIKAFEDERDIYFLVDDNLVCFRKNGKNIEGNLRSFFHSNDRVIKDVIHIEALHFGPLQKILTGNI